MSDQNQKPLVIGLAATAVVLVAVVGVLIYNQATGLPQPTVSPAETPVAQAPTTPATPTTGTPQGGVVPAAGAPIDPKTATKVEGDDIEAFVDAYYKATMEGDWQAAFDHLPAGNKANNSPDALKDQVSSYGIDSYTIVGSQVEGDRASVTADQVTGSFGTFVNTWTFAKVDGVWYAESKKVSGMK